MNGRNLLIAVLVVLILGAAALGGYSKFKESFTTSPIPSPSPSPDILFPEKEVSQDQLIGQISPSKTPQTNKKMITQYQKFPGILKEEVLKNKKAVIQTAKGKIEFEIYPEASMAASSFIFLTSDGFYNNLTFHRVEPGFVIQGGDPLNNGRGGPGYQFGDEPVTRKYEKGIVAMANSGPNTNGSQFFITLADLPQLPPKYTIFGKVILGMDVAEKIKVGDVMNKVSIEKTY